MAIKPSLFDKQLRAIEKNGMMPYGPYRNELRYKKIYRPE